MWSGCGGLVPGLACGNEHCPSCRDRGWMWSGCGGLVPVLAGGNERCPSCRDTGWIWRGCGGQVLSLGGSTARVGYEEYIGGLGLMWVRQEYLHVGIILCVSVSTN